MTSSSPTAATWLPTLADGSVHCCVTSPRRTGDCATTGTRSSSASKPRPRRTSPRMVAVFREVRRVLRDDGTLWLNLGDSYADDRGGSQGQDGRAAWLDRIGNRASSECREFAAGPTEERRLPSRKGPRRHPVARRVRAAGRRLVPALRTSSGTSPTRCPSRVTDRPTKAHEYVFLLSRSAAVLVRREGDCGTDRRTERSDIGGGRYCARLGSPSTLGLEPAMNATSCATPAPSGPSRPSPTAARTSPRSRPRSSRRCIMAGCPLGGTCSIHSSAAARSGRCAESLGRKWLGCELNQAYEPLIRERTKQRGLPFRRTE